MIIPKDVMRGEWCAPRWRSSREIVWISVRFVSAIFTVASVVLTSMFASQILTGTPASEMAQMIVPRLLTFRGTPKQRATLQHKEVKEEESEKEEGDAGIKSEEFSSGVGPGGDGVLDSTEPPRKYVKHVLIITNCQG